MIGAESSRTRLLGAVLAGGASRRLGRDKAAETVGRRRLIDHAVRALSGVCAEVVVVSSRAATPTGDWRVVPDRRAGAGPLAGIETALAEAERSGHEAAFVLACDLPFVDEAVVAFIARALDQAPAVAPVASERHGEPGFEPLCAVYRTACLPTATALLDRGERSARALLAAVGGERIGVDRAVFLNVNTEEDLARARDRAVQS